MKMVLQNRGKERTPFISNAALVPEDLLSAFNYFYRCKLELINNVLKVIISARGLSSILSSNKNLVMPSSLKFTINMSCRKH